MSFLKPTDIKDVFLHLLIMTGAVALMVTMIFYVWLPITTNHGETITIPDIRGLTVTELEKFLKKRDLYFEVTADSSYSPDYPPLTVLSQVPTPNTKVKENRKIYVTLNTESPPKIRMPKIEDLSLKSAQMVLKSYNLKLGEVKFVPDIFFGVVHEAKLNGVTILEGEKIEKGSIIDLITGDGYGNTIFQSPNIIGLNQEEAEFVIIGAGLKVGKMNVMTTKQADFTVKDSTGADVSKYKKILHKEIAPGSVLYQHPLPGRRLKIGDPIDLWVYKPDSINDTPTILDNL